MASAIRNRKLRWRKFSAPSEAAESLPKEPEANKGDAHIQSWSMEPPLASDNTGLLERMNVPYLNHKETLRFLRTHGRLLFLLRGPPGSGKGVVASELQRLYPDSRAYCADMFFSSPTAPERSRDTMRTSHVLCARKMEGFMVENVPVVINRNTNIMVWEIAVCLVLAAKYGYTPILIDLPRYVGLNTEVLAMTNNKGLDQSYLSHRTRMWEDVYPFATGWSPRPGDAAWLLHRFHQIRMALKRDDAKLALQDVANDKVFPFFFARICAFGRTSDSRDYCVSQKVKQAYGRTDVLRVFGFAVAQGFVFAMALLSKDQTLLTTGDRGEPARNAVAATWAFPGLCKQACVVSLAKHAPESARGNEQHILRQASDRVSLSDVDPARVTFMPLGSTAGVYYTYDRAVAAGCTLLSSTLPAWKTSVGPKRHGDGASGFDVFGSTGTTSGACLLVDSATAQLEVVFTGYYQPYVTKKSRDPWSRMQGMLGRPLLCGYRSSLSVPIAGTKRPHPATEQPRVHSHAPSNSKETPLAVAAEMPPPPKRVRGRQGPTAVMVRKKRKSAPKLSKQAERQEVGFVTELPTTSASAVPLRQMNLQPRHTPQPDSALKKSRAIIRTDRGTRLSGGKGREASVAKRPRKTSPVGKACVGKAAHCAATGEASPPSKMRREMPARRCKAMRITAGSASNAKRNTGQRLVRGKVAK